MTVPGDISTGRLALNTRYENEKQNARHKAGPEGISSS
jgi:hypothetical protein